MRCCLKLGVGGGARARRFEAIYRDYFSLQVRSEKLKNMRNIGSYYYYDPVHCRNGGFDAALEFSDGYDIHVHFILQGCIPICHPADIAARHISQPM